MSTNKIMIKNLRTLAVLLSLTISASAQYYLLPGGQGNPGGVNTEDDQPFGTYTGWTSLLNPSSTPIWSNSTAIPFNFEFNNAPVTSFTVSSSGVLTFSQNPGIAPAFSAVALPSASIPDSSIAILGIQGSGANDKVAHKTFGTAPNRQMWISFMAYSVVGSTSNFVFYSIVLEETTNRIFIVDQRANTPLTGGISMGVQINDTLAIAVQGSPNAGTFSGTSHETTDNIHFEYAYGTQSALDLATTAILNGDYAGLAQNGVDIKFETLNRGTDTITELDINYSINNGATVSSTVTGLSIAPLDRVSMTAPTQWVPAALGMYDIKVWTSALNGAADMFPADDTASHSLEVLDFVPIKKVVIEEGTGTWCGWCPRGAVGMELLENNYHENFIGIAIHNGDLMVNQEYDDAAGITGFPGMNVDRRARNASVSISSMENFVQNWGVGVLADAQVNILHSAIDYAAESFTITMEARFVNSTVGDYRFSVIVVEDSVTGTSSPYNQRNYYAGGSQGPLVGAGHSWHTAPDPVPASQMVYNHVGRQIVGGYRGVEGSLPDTIQANTPYQFIFNEDFIGNIQNFDNVKFVVLVLNPQGEIVNAEQAKPINYTSRPEFEIKSVLYPNPTSGITGLDLTIAKKADVTVSIINMIGAQVYNTNQTLSEGTHRVELDLSSLPAGMYNAAVAIDGQTVNHKIMIQ